MNEIWKTDSNFPLLRKDVAIEDFIVNIVPIDDIVKMSVGIVTEVKEKTITVLFIGKSKSLELTSDQYVIIDVNKTGKPVRSGKPNKYKICNVCHILKQEYVDFQINQTDSSGRKTTRPSCNTCRTVIDGEKLKLKEKRRMEATKPSKYYVCPICNKASIPFVTANYVIDHDHNTGMARSWICDSCNTGLGRFKDDIDVMLRAIEYLKSQNKSK